MTTRVAEVDERRILFANTETLLWPEANISKGDLIDYYVELADVVLPFLAQRPLSLLRCPDGVAGECVYQKTAPPGLPQWIPTRRLRSDQAALGYAEYVIGSERAALAYLVNLGYTSFHPWACLVEAVDRPDLMLFDLDPTEIAFREVRNAALLVRSLLAGFKIRSWVKTSGGAGVHVIVPLDPVYSFEQTLTAASTITRMARQREPSLFTFDMRRARRRGKILIDVLRNRRGATLVSPYAVREYLRRWRRRSNGASSSAACTRRIFTSTTSGNGSASGATRCAGSSPSVNRWPRCSRVGARGVPGRSPERAEERRHGTPDGTDDRRRT